MQHRLYGLRGQSYTLEYIKLFNELGEEIKNDFNKLLKDNGKFSAMNLGEMCVKHRIPVKVMDEWLPELTDGVYPVGKWESLRDRGVTAKDIGVVWA